MRRSDLRDTFHRDCHGGPMRARLTTTAANRLRLSMSIRMIPIRRLDREPKAKRNSRRTDELRDLMLSATRANEWPTIPDDHFTVARAKLTPTPRRDDRIPLFTAVSGFSLRRTSHSFEG
jgi:hypothetical protein